MLKEEIMQAAMDKFGVTQAMLDHPHKWLENNPHHRILDFSCYEEENGGINSEFNVEHSDSLNHLH